MEPTKTPTRDYPSLAENDWKLWDTLYRRRSSRKYIPMEVSREWASKIEEMTKNVLEARGAAERTIAITVNNRSQIDKLKRTAFRGLFGLAANPWLPRGEIGAFVVFALPRDDTSAERPRVLPHMSMAIEDMVLWLTEKGFATCWLGGINCEAVRKVVGLGKEWMIPYMISLGKPIERVRGRNVDNFANRIMSRKRKAIPMIASKETYGKKFVIGDFNSMAFRVSDTQDIAGLLRNAPEDGSLANGLPMEVAMEACLEAARVAPSASNSQKWHFTVVTSKEKLKDVAAACGGAKDWKAAIVGSGLPTGYYPLVERSFWMTDLPIAFSHISLMAASMGFRYEVCINDCDYQALADTIALPQDQAVVGVVGLV